VRYPTDRTADAQSQNSYVATQLDSNALMFRRRIYLLLTNYHDYTTFSNEAWIPGSSPSAYDSLESIHDSIHGLTGNEGHMTYIYYSAFDPLFFLHHAQIDRLFAMWQILNPDTYVVPEPATYATFTTSAGETQDINTPLTPFYKDFSGAFWTSADARTTEIFGYTYPETSSSTGIGLQKQVITAINALYGPATETASQEEGNLSARSASHRSLKHWIANIRIQKTRKDFAFSIHIFIGAFNPDSRSWDFDQNFVGTHTILMKHLNSSSLLSTVVSTSMPLTDVLLNHIRIGYLVSLADADVELYLIKNMKYKVTFLNGTEISDGHMPRVEISVVSVVMQVPASNEKLPVWNKMKMHMEISNDQD
jgi:tyrosinase